MRTAKAEFDKLRSFRGNRRAVEQVARRLMDAGFLGIEEIAHWADPDLLVVGRAFDRVTGFFLAQKAYEALGIAGQRRRS